MIYTTKIKNAIKFATKTHEIYQQQKRKGKDIPYITHPLTAGLILSLAGASEDVIVAGILHDTIEDSTAEKKVTSEMIAERFGQNVANLVLSVTEENKELTWEERKEEALEHIKTFSNDSLLVKSADIISNATELIDDYGQDGEEVFARFNAPKEKILEYQLRAITAIIQKWPESPLANDLKSITTGLEKITQEQASFVGRSEVMKNVLLGAYEENEPSWYVPVFIINMNPHPIDLTLALHGIQSDEDNVVDLGMGNYKKITVPANGALEIDRMNDVGELDFTTEYWVRHEGKQHLATISGTGLYFGSNSKILIPVLNRIGYVSNFR